MAGPVKLHLPAHAQDPFTWFKAGVHNCKAFRLLDRHSEGADELAAGSRTAIGEHGKTFVANVPKALLDQLERSGLATRSVTMMGETVGTEIRFSPTISEFITRFF